MSEYDPHGIDQHAPGAKLDAGKPKVAFALSQFFTAISQVNAVSEYGANKYTVNGWRNVPDGEGRYMEALLRHLAEHKDGELLDKDTGLPHVAHMAWNALAVVEFVCKNHISQLTQKLSPSISDAEQDPTLLAPAPWMELPKDGEHTLTLLQEKSPGEIRIGKKQKSTLPDSPQCSTTPNLISELLGPLIYL